MGSAVTYHLAKKGLRVLGLEKYSMNHDYGSSHGRTRIIRTAYFEHPSYVPLVQRASELWFALQAEAEMNLIKMTGGLMLGKPASRLVSGTLRSVKEHDLQHEVLEPKEIVDRFPAFHPHEGEIGVYEKNAGILYPEECIKAHDTLAEKYGAELHFNEPIIQWNVQAGVVRVRTAKGTYTGNSAVIATGSWMPQVVPELNPLLQCERQILFWFRPVKDQDFFMPERMPVFIWATGDLGYFYGFPDLGDGVKVARHHGGELTSPEKVRRQVTVEDETPVREFLSHHIPSANGLLLSSATCLYTNTPDEHFIISHHPKHRNVIILSPCSGHGFKFASAIGEIATQMIKDGRAKLDISMFNLTRLVA
jgi:sarcosine oxidase